MPAQRGFNCKCPSVAEIHCTFNRASNRSGQRTRIKPEKTKGLNKSSFMTFCFLWLRPGNASVFLKSLRAPPQAVLNSATWTLESSSYLNLQFIPCKDAVRFNSSWWSWRLCKYPLLQLETITKEYDAPLYRACFCFVYKFRSISTHKYS